MHKVSIDVLLNRTRNGIQNPHFYNCVDFELNTSYRLDQRPVLYKILSISISITKYILKMYFNDFCQLLWPSSPKYKILLTKVTEIENTFRSHCKSVDWSINQYSFNSQEKPKHISRLGIGTVTVQCTVNKKNHWKYWLRHNT